ncbi:MAG: hypothetical protein Q7U57_07790 [Methylovulum sp.]|nr:hypothetical protein [Methylovulum sp.]
MKTLNCKQGVCIALLAIPFQARAANINVAPITVSAGTAAAATLCPNTSPYHYIGGKIDAFALPSDLSAASSNLNAYMGTLPSTIMSYDTAPLFSQQVGDSFYLQPGRTVCYAMFKYGMQKAVGFADDQLLIGTSSNAFTTPVASVSPPVLPNHPTSVTRTFALNAAGRNRLTNLLSTDHVLDVHLQDNTKLDYIEFWVWYDQTPPPCTGLSGVTVGSNIVYTFKGTLNDAFGTLPIGTPFTGTLTYPIQAINPNPANPTVRGDYISQSITLTMGGNTVSDSGAGIINVYDDTYPTDLFHFYNTSAVNGNLGGETLASGAGIQLALQDLSKTAWSSVALPGAGLTMGNLTAGNATFVELNNANHTANARGELCH